MGAAANSTVNSSVGSLLSVGSKTRRAFNQSGKEEDRQRGTVKRETRRYWQEVGGQESQVALRSSVLVGEGKELTK